MEDFKELKELNLDENEIKIYVSALKLGKSKCEQIAKLSGVIRTTTYSILQKLKLKGIISNILIDNINFFEAINPDDLLEKLEEKKQKIKSILPQLKKLQLNEKKSYGITFFEGREGVKSVMNDIISKPNSKIKTVGSVYNFSDNLEFFSKEYFRKKKERNIVAESVSFDRIQDRGLKEFDKKYLRDVRFMDKEFVKSGCFIYENKVAFLTYEDDNQKGFIIEDEQISKLVEYMFDALFKESKK